MLKNKNYHIESLRGIAIILVVLGHVIGSGPEGGLKIEFPSNWRYIYCWIDIIQLPLFTAIAGWVYALKPIEKGLKQFIFEKIKRLILPMLIIAPVYYILQCIIPGTNTSNSIFDLWRVFLFSYSIYWYLYALFIIFIMIAIIDKYKKANTLSGWFKILIISILTSLIFKNTSIDNIPNIFCFLGGINQLPYFLIGLGLYRFKDALYKKSYYLILGIISLTISFLAINMEWINLCEGNNFSFYHNIILRIAACGLLVPICYIKFKNRILSFIGKYSFSIYMFHVFFTSSVRIFLNKIGLTSLPYTIIIITVLAISIPVILEMIINKNHIAGKYLLGRKQYINS